MSPANVTVMLPLFEAGAPPGPAIDSVRRQTVSSWELLIGVDERDKDQRTMLAQLAAQEPRLRILSCDSASTFLRQALRAATTPCVTYLDCRYEFYPNFFELVLAWGLPAELLVCGWDLQRPAVNTIRPSGESLDPHRCYDRLLTDPVPSPSGVLHGRDTLDRLGPAESGQSLQSQRNPWWRLADSGARFLPVPIQAGVWHVPQGISVTVPAPAPLAPLPASVTVESPLVIGDVGPWERSLLERHGLRGLHCGCGPLLQPGWVNTDRDPLPGPEKWVTPAETLVRVGAHYFYLRHDATRPYPFGDESFEWAYSEHFVEHISRREAVMWLREVRRMLRPGGVARISTPDLRKYVEGYLDPEARFFTEHARRLHTMFQRQVPKSRAWMVNQIFYAWGHRWIYDFDELRTVAVEAGFRQSAVHGATFRQSSVPEMAAMDQERRCDESLYVELCA
jgi:predicted SAM-dependent methyltransferase